LTEAMDIEGLKDILNQIASGKIRCIAVETPVPSQFSHEILNANPYAYLDDAPLEERRARAVEMRRMLPESMLSEVGRLDPAAIAEVREEAWPDIRDADELHDLLQTLIALPDANNSMAGSAESDAIGGSIPFRQKFVESFAEWAQHFAELESAHRAARAFIGDRGYLLAAEKAATFASLFPNAQLESRLAEIEIQGPSREDGVLACVTGWMAHLGPITSNVLATFLGIDARDIEKTFLRMEGSGSILRGRFTNTATDTTEWCDRRLLARIHRLTLGSLRSQIQPATAAQFMRWLLRWQHVAQGTQVLGERGTLEILQQLQGFEAPANSWERQILARRIANYDPKVLDQLCLTGAVGWGRLSPHPASLEDSNSINRRVVPSSVAPIAFFVREDSDWMISRHANEYAEFPRGLSEAAREALNYLRQRGASFFTDLVRGTGKLKAEMETALWELVTAGMITADGFDNIRALIDPKRRAGQGRGHSTRPRHSSGRWSLLFREETTDRARAVDAICWMLLKRYGVVFRELIARETIVPRWRELLIALRRLEDRGEIRGGRFVSGFIGEQFALPVAVESLRATRDSQSSGETVIISAADPLNLVGILLPGSRVSAVSGKFVALRDGVFVETEDLAVGFAHPLAG
jgi:ATP-dependent Lhr-like helicase